MKYMPLLCLWFVSVFIVAEEQPDSMIFCYEDKPVPPFMGVESTRGEHNGAIIDLVNEAATLLDVEIIYIRRPWKRCISELKTGNVDSIFLAIWNEERDEWGAFPKKNNSEINLKLSVYITEYNVFVHRNSLITWDGNSFGGINFGIGGPLGYVVTKRLAKMDVLYKQSLSAEEGFVLLNAHRLDGYVISTLEGNQLISKHNLTNLRMLSIPFSKNSLFIPLSHKFQHRYPEFSQRFWKTAAELRETKLPDYLERWTNPAFN